MKMRVLLEDAHTKVRNLSEMEVVYEHEGREYEVAQFDIARGKLVLKTWPILPGTSPSVR